MLVLAVTAIMVTVFLQVNLGKEKQTSLDGISWLISASLKNMVGSWIRGD